MKPTEHKSNEKILTLVLINATYGVSTLIHLSCFLTKLKIIVVLRLLHSSVGQSSGGAVLYKLSLPHEFAVVNS